jgi:hypothetical protein
MLTEREKTHGDYSWNAFITQKLKQVLHSAPNYPKINDAHKECFDMICHKLSRAVQNPDFLDHWDDIAGYAKLGAEHCQPPEGKA